jgi:hypothetical protein
MINLFIRDRQPAIDKMIALAEKHYKLHLSQKDACIIGMWASSRMGGEWSMQTTDEAIIEWVGKWTKYMEYVGTYHSKKVPIASDIVEHKDKSAQAKLFQEAE